MRALSSAIDERLLVEAAQKDRSRFAELYEANFDRVYAYVAHRVPVRHEAEDLTAEVFHQALVGLDSYEWRGLPFIAWLLGIAGNLVAQRWKKAVPQVEADELEAAADEGVERRALFLELLEMLPEDQRLVIVRRFVDGRSIREIALELGRSEGAVKQLQFRALQSLRARARK